MNELQLLKAELSALPKGTIVWKRTSKNSDAKRPYLQWREGTKTKSRYIQPGELDAVTKNVERRRQIHAEIQRFTFPRSH